MPWKYYIICGICKGKHQYYDWLYLGVWFEHIWGLLKIVCAINFISIWTLDFSFDEDEKRKTINGIPS